MKKNFASKILSGILAGALAFTTCFAEYVPVFAEQSVSSGGTVYISISDDDAYVISDSAEHEGTVMAYVPVSIDAIAQEIDLDEYGYGDLVWDEDEDGSYETTLLQGFLYVLEHYYSGGTSDLNITGGSGSSYMQSGFWGHDENLTYYVNGEYPLKTGSTSTGSTSDEIVLHDGDFIDVSMYSDWNFWFDPEAGYHYFGDADGQIAHEFQATAGVPMSVSYLKTFLDTGADWSNIVTELNPCDGSIYYGTAMYETEEDPVETTDGVAEITFPEAGTYYLWSYGEAGASAEGIVSSPAYAKVTVAAATEPDPEETTVDVTIICQSDNVFLTAPETVTVSSLEAENYGYTDSVEGVSALDALVKAHEILFAEDFTAETAGEFLAAGSTGFVTTIFGDETSANGFLVNDGYPNDGTESPWGGYNGTTVTTTALADGDKVDFFIYGDRSYYSDYFTFTEVPEFVEAGADFDVNVSAVMVMMGYEYADPEEFRAAAEALEDAGLAWVDGETFDVLPIVYADDEELVVTDEDGVATITAPEEPGLYYLTAISNEEEMVSVLMNIATVTVTEPEEPPVPVVEAEVTVRSQMENVYLAPIDAAVTVASDLAESYGYTDSVVGEVSALDALVKAHEVIFGEDFTAETKDEFLAVGSTGFVTKLFGEATSSNGFLVNAGYPNDGTESPWGGYNGTTVSTTALADGDVVDFFVYGDTSTWSDYFTYTEVPEEVPAGTEFDVAVSGTYIMMGYMYADAVEMKDAAEAIEDAALAWVDPSTGDVYPIVYAEDEELVVTDEDGVATITAPDEPGTYCLTAISNEDEYVYAIMNPVAVTVTEAPVPVEITATIKYNTPSTSLALYAMDDEDKENNLLSEDAKEGTTYTVTLEAGQYIAEAFTGEISNGTIVLDIDAENTAFEIFTVTAYCSTSGWTYGTDYTIEQLLVLSGGDKATVVREVTMGDSSTAGRKTFPVLMGDSYSFYGTPIGSRAEGFVPTYKQGVVTATNYTTASFAMSAKTGLSVTVPYADTDADGQNDYILEVGQMFNYYIYTYMDPVTDDIDAEAGTETQTFETAKSAAYFYRVTNPLMDDAVTYGNYITCSADANTATVTAADMKIGDASLDKGTVIKDFSQNGYDTGDIYLNINEKGYINLASGSTYNLYPFRNWLAIESISNAKVIEPDFHVEVLGDAVSVTEKTENNASKHSYEIKAEQPGTAIVLVTYDAMYDAIGMGSKPVFSAIWPENTGVFVVTVDGNPGIETGMTINEGLNAGAKLSGDAYDADLDVLYYTGDEGATYTFTPEAGTDVAMAVGQISGGKMTFGGFTSEGVTKNADGSVTLSGLKHGKTIVKLTNGGRTEYQVLKALKVTYTITNQNGDVVGTDAGLAEGAVIKANDELTFAFDRIYIPANKLSGIYNMSGSIKYTGEDGTTFSGTANQYLFASTAACQTVKVKIPKFWVEDTYTLNGFVFESGFGSAYGCHRLLTYEAGKAPNFTAVVGSGSFGSMPAITLPITETVFLNGAFTFVDENGNALPANVGTITLKDFENSPVAVTAEGTFKASAGTYSYVVNAEGYEYAYGSVELTDDGENSFQIVLQTSSEGAWDGASMAQPQQDEEETYLISNGAELKWFQNEVTVNKAKTINAKLTADINLAKYPWTPIGTTSSQMGGTFDGAGHEIYNLYCNGTSTLALFGCTTGTVKDLTVSGDVVGTGGTLAGVVAYAQGTNANNKTRIINVVNNVNVTQNSASASSGSIGGIAGYAYWADFENCVNNGTITTISTSQSATGYAGIVGYVMNYDTTVTGCKNTAPVTGRKNVGGIVGYAGGNKPVLSTCYNTGDISGYTYVGGIVGDLQGAAFAHGYNTGAVTAEAENGAQPVAGDSKSGFNATDAYYLNTIADTAACGTALTADQLAGRSIEGFGTCCEGAPALLWEDAQFHQKGEGVVTAPTCTEEGYTVYTCPNCEKTFTGDYVPANGHTPNITDQHVGVGYGTCSVCGVELTVWDDERLASLDYDEEAVSAISITDTGAYPWIVSEQDHGLTSGNKGIDSSTSASAITFTLSAPAQVSFGYLVSSETNYDKLTVSVGDGTTVTTLANAISGNNSGTYDESLEPGTYTLTMSFYKDSSSASGRDLGAITNFKIVADTELVILQQPQPIASAMAGDTLAYSVTAKNAAEYQWQYSKDGENWINSNLSKAQTAEVTMKAAPVNLANSYRCKITGVDGTVVYTDVAGVEAVETFSITQQPVNWDAADGKDVVFTVAAENAASYQWQYSKDGGATWKKSTLTGETPESISLKISTSNMMNKYRCKVTAANGAVLYSDVVGITGVPVITQQPLNWNLSDGTTITYAITAENAESYQWYYSKDGGATWKKSTVSTAATNAVRMKYAPVNAENVYRCKVTDTNGIYVYSEVVGIIAE